MLTKTLLEIIGTGGAAVIGAVLSWVLAYAPYVGPWFATLSYEAKRLFLMAVCLAIGVGAVGILYTQGYPVDVDLVFMAVLQATVAYTASQGVHLVIREKAADKAGCTPGCCAGRC